nr:ankyrin repeat-containing domain, PGG domain protein [Tanacetum cinerariifolium]
MKHRAVSDDSRVKSPPLIENRRTRARLYSSCPWYDSVPGFAGPCPHATPPPNTKSRTSSASPISKQQKQYIATVAQVLEFTSSVKVPSTPPGTSAIRSLNRLIRGGDGWYVVLSSTGISYKSGSPASFSGGSFQKSDRYGGFGCSRDGKTFKDREQSSEDRFEPGKFKQRPKTSSPKLLLAQGAPQRKGRLVMEEVGNTNFLLELIRRSPDLIWKVNDDNQTIFHVAVKNRHVSIYNLLYEIGAMKDMEVERMVPSSYRERQNKDGLTPSELFTKEHQDLITQSEKWMKATASQCMVVATLIATIVFAAAFTVPGGYNQNDGIPMFKQKLSFISFVVADAISLFLSSASILTFLSILTSRYAEHDFVRSLPMKLMAGLATLFLSIGTMMVTFSVSFFILYHNEMKWIPIFISLFAVTPAILYVALQYHLLIDVFHSTYG